MYKGMLLGTLSVRPSLQQTCNTHEDCKPLCGSCDVCVCVHGFCVSGCSGPPPQELGN